MSPLDSSKCTVRLPYYERFSSTPLLEQPNQYVQEQFSEYPDVPADLYDPTDKMLTPGDKQRLNTSQEGDPMNGYPYGSAVRLSMLMDQKASLRLGISHLERLDPFVVKVLRAQKALTSFVVRTALDEADQFFQETDSTLRLKQEADQPIGAYKLRGAAYKLLQLSSEQLREGVVAASAGNHAQGVAYAARQLGAVSTLVMPLSTPEVKVEGVRQLGANVVLKGKTFEEALSYAQWLIAERPSLTFIPPYDDEDVITGQATVGAEILQQYPEVTAIGVPVGGGGLLAGIARYVAMVRPDVAVYGIEPTGSAAMTASLRAGHRVTLASVDNFAEGVAVAQVGEKTYDYVKQYVGEPRMVTVKRKQLAEAVVDLNEAGLPTEPAGALGLAGLRKVLGTVERPHNFVAIRSGRNLDASKLREAHVLALADD